MADNPLLAKEKSRRDLAKELLKLQKDLHEEYKDQGDWMSKLLGIDKQIVTITDEIVTTNKQGLQVTRDQAKEAITQIKANQEIRSAIAGQLGFITKFRNMAKSVNLMLKANPLLLLAGVLIGIVTLFLKFQKGVAEVKKDLGVSTIEAVKLQGAFKGLAFVGKAYGLELEDIKESFAAARSELGATTDEALALSLNLAKVAMETGTTATEFTKVLSIMESVSSASRDSLMSQIETSRQLIEQAGLAPGDIFKDLANNADFFAGSIKDGGDQLIRAAINAKKLGLNMDTVAKISESLLDFESSIEKQMEASMLLGREINLDRARQLNYLDKTDEAMEEILRQVGGEAEFGRLLNVQRRSLAAAVGVDVEELSRMVRNNTTASGAGIGAVGAAVGTAAEETKNVAKGIADLNETIIPPLTKIARNTEEMAG
jgi:plasmid maintenance system antidote protein VapI|tara:strand:- start:55 stop:1344 length:1290 start_codon:yes stop_codon:yes gene_type:complete